MADNDVGGSGVFEHDELIGDRIDRRLYLPVAVLIGGAEGMVLRQGAGQAECVRCRFSANGRERCAQIIQMRDVLGRAQLGVNVAK
ncbi:MAG: hypothetical protein ACD_10C00693G0004 [uncultured bacterium]|nr:MAG: hypothetical protein ACD_10C00693G0004 [uncultured bacterium]